MPSRNATHDRRIIDGAKVGERARSDLGVDPLWPSRQGDAVTTASLAQTQLLAEPHRPAVEVPMVRDGLYVRADALVPIAGGYALRETKASTFPLKRDKVTPDAPEDHYLDDVAIQAWVMQGSRLPLARVELNLLDSRWRYPGDGDYAGLFRQLDAGPLTAELTTQVPQWLRDAQAVVAGPLPDVRTGRQCKEPYDCPFLTYCKSQEPPEPAHPLELLPGLVGKNLARKLKETKGYVSLLEPAPDELTGKAAALYRRIQVAHRDGEAQLDPAVRTLVAGLQYPRYYFDFEGIDLPVPRWAGVRPYEHVPFQWSCHIETAPGEFTHREFLDLTGDDPSLPCIAAMQAAIGSAGGSPIVVYHATYEKGRLEQLAERHPEHAALLQGYIKRLVDLLPLVKDHFYDPRMRGYFSIKKVLPTVAPDLRYDELEEVQEGTGAQVAYLQAIFERLPSERLLELDQRLRRYCRQDTWAMVEIAHFLAGRARPVRPAEA